MASKTRLSFAVSMLLFVFTVLVVVVDSSSNYPRKLLNRVPAARDASSLPLADDVHVQYEPGMVVETVLDGNRLGMSISMAVPFQDSLFALDSTGSQILKTRLPIDQSKGAAMARRVAGDGRGRTGYIDGWSEGSLFDRPKGLAVDGDGNVYVADVRNRVIRKITPAGYVSTVAGRSNTTGHADGEGKEALFSADFDLTYLPRTCSLLISDRGNNGLRVIQLKPVLKCSEQVPSSGHLWEYVIIFVCGILAPILLPAAFRLVNRKWELQRSSPASLALEDQGELPFSGNPNGGASNMPFLNGNSTAPLLANSAATLRGGRSLSDDVPHLNFCNRSDLMDFSDVPSQEREYTRPTNLLENSAADGLGDADNDVVPSISSAGDEGGDGTTTPERVRIRLPQHDLLSDSESILTGPNDAFSRHLHSSSALVAPDRRISLDEELNRNLQSFSHNSSN